MRILITGGAGFIGSNLIEELIQNNEIIVIDDLSSGKKEFLEPFLNKLEFHKVDLSKDNLEDLFKVEEVWHLAANPSVKDSSIKTFFNELKITKNVLEASAKNKVKKILFTSSSTVYGEAIPNTPENYETKPISFYGASKLACESLISAYCSSYKIQGFLFRLANIIGKNSNHGVIYDFINKIQKDKKQLEILGDGNQTKSYLYVEDCVNAMLIAKEKARDEINIFNIGNRDWVNVKKIADIVVDEMFKANLIKEKPQYKFTGGERGWKGDVKEMLLSIDKLKEINFKPKYSSEEAVRKTSKQIIKNLGIL